MLVFGNFRRKIAVIERYREDKGLRPLEAVENWEVTPQFSNDGRRDVRWFLAFAHFSTFFPIFFGRNTLKTSAQYFGFRKNGQDSF